MHPFPHHYAVNASVRPVGDVPLSTDGVGIIESAPPKEFDGPGNQWSPEGLLTAAVADCFVLSFRAIAAASKFPWVSLVARTQGTLDRIDGKSALHPLRYACWGLSPPARGRGQRTREEAARKG